MLIGNFDEQHLLILIYIISSYKMASLGYKKRIIAS